MLGGHFSWGESGSRLLIVNQIIRGGIGSPNTPYQRFGVSPEKMLATSRCKYIFKDPRETVHLFYCYKFFLRDTNAHCLIFSHNQPFRLGRGGMHMAGVLFFFMFSMLHPCFLKV
jgi:hypothetical protein